MPSIKPIVPAIVLVALIASLAAYDSKSVNASSHREAPNITRHPKIDGTDFYLFRSYETGRENFVTAIADYYPLQNPQAGPNYFMLEERAIYEIHFDRDGDDVEDMTFQFKFKNENQDTQLLIGPPGQEIPVSIPLINSSPIDANNQDGLNVVEKFTVNLITGDRRTGQVQPITNAQSGATEFLKPVDYIGQKSIPDYESYAAAHIYDIDLPGTSEQGRLFVGQRKDPFVIQLGEAFDLVNSNPIGPESGKPNTFERMNVTCFVLELPISFLNPANDVVGAWTTSSLRQVRVLNPTPRPDTGAEVAGGAFVQQSRIANPLFNELLVGLKDKDRYNASEPMNDEQFKVYATNPAFPALLELLFQVGAPTQFPRNDLVQVFLTGVPGLTANGGSGEMMRLNVTIPPVPQGMQDRMGVLGNDLAGYPNGRRPGDDIVDITLRVAMGALLDPAVAPSGSLPLTDGVLCDDSLFDNKFPYVKTPTPGSPATLSTAIAGSKK